MAFPPLNVFTQNCRPEESLAQLQEWLPGAKVIRGADGVWTEIQGEWKRGFLKKALGLKVAHSPEYYAGPGWETQRSGMAGYFGRFPGAEGMPRLFEYFGGLTFALSFMLDSEPVDDDPRLKVVFMMAEFLDGVIFLPGRLLDAKGKVIIDGDGENDPEARVPPCIKGEGIGQWAIDEACEPPDQERVVNRLLLMAALVQKGFIEKERGEEYEQMRGDLVTRLQSSGAWEAAEPWEAEALECPLGSLGEKRQWQLPWLSEGAMVLAWAVGLTELPPYDEQVDVGLLMKIVGLIEDGLAEPTLRDDAEMEKLDAQMLAIHWRLREFYVNAKPIDFTMLGEKAWCGKLDLSLARLVGNDLEVNGCALAESSEDNWKCASGIMEERRKAIGWLRGRCGVYSEVDTST